MIALVPGSANCRSNDLDQRGILGAALRVAMESGSKPITPMTVRPKRVLLAIAVGMAMLFPVLDIYARAKHRYLLWRADGIQCMTFEADGTLVGRYYAAEHCGQ